MMHALFIPAHAAGSIVCQRIQETTIADTKRERLRDLRAVEQLLKVTHLMPRKGTLIATGFGVRSDSTPGILVAFDLAQADEVVGLSFELISGG